MAFRRKRFSRRPVRRTFNRRRAFGGRRRSFRRRFPRNPVYHFKTLTIKEVLSVTSATVDRAYSFNIQDVNSINPLISTNFDAYRINKIVVKVIPNHNVANIGAAAGAPAFPQIVDLVDYDDNAALGTTSAYLAYNSVRTHMGDKPWHRKFTPACRMQVDSGGAGTGSVQKFKQWIDAADLTVPHFGYKIQFVPIAGTTGTSRYEIWAKYYYSCKQLR